MRRVLRLLMFVLGGLLVLVVVVVGLAQTGIAKRQLVRLIGDLASSTDMTVTIGGMTGVVPIGMELTDIRIADQEGVWLTIDHGRLDWSPQALLSSQFRIEALELGRVDIARSPAAAGTVEDSAPFEHPRLPIGLDLRHLVVEQIVLAPPVVGTAMTLAIDGQALVGAGRGGVDARLDVERIDGVAGQAAVTVAYEPVAETLAIDLAVTEPAGGLLARLGGFPGLPPITMRLTGDGPLDQWQATLGAEAGDGATVTGTAQARAVEGGRQLTVDIGASLAELLDPEMVPVIGDDASLTASVTFADDGAIQIGAMRLAGAALSAEVEGSIRPDERQLDLAFALALDDPDAVEAFVSGIALASGDASGRISGDWLAPRVDLELAARDVAAGEITAAEATATIGAAATQDLSEPGAAIALDLTVRAGDPRLGNAVIEALLGPEVVVTLKGTLGMDGTLVVEAANVSTPAGQVGAAARATGWGAGEATASTTLTLPDLAAFQPLVGMPLGGAAELAIAIEPEAGGWRARLTGSIANPVTSVAQVDLLLGASASIDAEAIIGADNSLTVPHLTITGEGVSLTGDGVVMSNAVAAGWTLRVDDMARLGYPLAGAAELVGDLSGPLGRPTLGGRLSVAEATIAGLDVPRADVDFVVSDLATPAARIDLTGIAAGQDVALSADVALVEDGAIGLTDLALQLASATLAGALTVAPDGTATGQLAGRVERLADFAAFVPVPLSGAASVELALSAVEGRQDATVTLDGSSVAVADILTAGSLTAEVGATDLLGAPTMTATATASSGTLSGQRFDNLRASAEGGLDRLEVSATASGSGMALDGRGTVTLGEAETRVDLAALDLGYGGERFRMTGPATIVAGAEGTRITGLSLAARGGSLALDATIGQTLAVDLTLQNIPLAIAAMVTGVPPPVEGTASGRLNFAGSLASPSGSFDLQLAGGRLSDAGGVPGFDAALAGTWENGRLEATGSLSPSTGGRLDLTAAMSLGLDPASFGPVVGDDLTARARGQFDLAAFNDLLAAGADQIAGTVAVDLGVSGGLDQLVGEGTVTLSNGTYRNSIYGIELAGIGAELAGSGQSLTLTRLDATTPGGGTLTGSGRMTLDPAAGLPADFRLSLRDAQVIDTQQTTARADAELTLTGPMTSAPRLAGTVTLRSAEYNIAAGGAAAGVPTIAVEEINVPPELAARRPQAAPGGARATAFEIALDLDVAAPNQMFVRGRGLDAELGGQVKITGTASRPIVTGQLDMRRGDMALLGRDIVFDRGTLTFDGSPEPDPRLDFEATTPAEGVEIQVLVTGRGSNPQIEFASSPELPQDEVLARLLFGKATGELSALEAVTLAQSAAELAGLGGGASILNNVRQAIGVDRLDLDLGEGGEGPAVTAGRYVTDRVFFGVRQDLAGGGSKAMVEVEITPNIKVQADVGTQSTGRLGITFEWEY